ncbi:MAG: peptidylprolyl isomerase [Deltaproteobacteria bacterium]|nr:peptidylprolyl isomerase [Deltaproteobacteria bacterium]
MSQAKEGDTVKIHYTGKLENGETFDSSKDREPLQFKMGGGQVIPGFEKGIDGMEVGQSKDITIPPEEAYGAKNEELVFEIERNKLPDHITPDVGMPLQMTQENGQPVNVVITALTDETITIDANHPLADKTLNFSIELVEIS